VNKKRAARPASKKLYLFLAAGGSNTARSGAKKLFLVLFFSKKELLAFTDLSIFHRL